MNRAAIVVLAHRGKARACARERALTQAGPPSQSRPPLTQASRPHPLSDM